MAHLFLVSENSSVEGFGGMHSAPACFLQESGGSSLGLKSNSPVFLDIISLVLVINQLNAHILVL